MTNSLENIVLGNFPPNIWQIPDQPSVTQITFTQLQLTITQLLGKLFWIL